MNERAQHKQQLIMQGALCRVQILNAGQTVRHAVDIRVLAEQAETAVFGMLKQRVQVQQANVQRSVDRILPVVLDGLFSASSGTTRAIRKPVLYGAMLLGAISVLPRFFKGRKSHD